MSGEPRRVEASRARCALDDQRNALGSQGPAERAPTVEAAKQLTRPDVGGIAVAAQRKHGTDGGVPRVRDADDAARALLIRLRAADRDDEALGALVDVVGTERDKLR